MITNDMIDPTHKKKKVMSNCNPRMFKGTMLYIHNTVQMFQI